MQRRGFTFVELCIGLCITSMVLGAVAAFSMAMSASWKQAQSTQSVNMVTSLVPSRIGSLIEDAKLICVVRNGSLTSTSSNSAAALIWAADNNNDGYIQYSELVMLEYKPATKSIVKYRATISGGGNDPTWHYSYAKTTAALNAFKSGLTAEPLLTDVDGGQFFCRGLASTTQLPVFEYQFQFKADNKPRTVYGTVVLRGPAPLPKD